MLYFFVPPETSYQTHFQNFLFWNDLELNSFLLQVPKYLSQQWEKATGRGEVGRLRICKYVQATAINHTNSDQSRVNKTRFIDCHHPIQHSVRAVFG